ncbi:MAG: fumarate hydratase, partial [Rhodospirillales bacterium]|nr:fumarate hydratase [Rhodospirillales bacterium]
MPDFAYREIFDLGADQTPYRKLTGDFVSPATFDGQSVLKVAPEAMSLLAAEAFKDISHLLRPSHLKQMRAILDDPEASDNDRFVALD